MDSKLPWDKLREETLTTVIKDLGLRRYGEVRTRLDMEELLRQVSVDGLDVVLKRQDRARQAVLEQSSSSDEEHSSRPAKRSKVKQPEASTSARRTRATRPAPSQTQVLDCVLITAASNKTNGAVSQANQARQKTFDGVVITGTQRSRVEYAVSETSQDERDSEMEVEEQERVFKPGFTKRTYARRKSRGGRHSSPDGLPTR